MDNINLPDALDVITKSYAHKLAEMEDTTVYAYVKGVVSLLEAQDKDITKYALVRISNPMEYRKNEASTILSVSSQYRIVPIEQLSNMPTYND